MRNIRWIPAFCFCICFSNLVVADVIMFEDMEDSTVNYTTSVPEFTDGDADFFIRTDGSDMNSNFVEFTNVQGSSYFAAMDLDGEGDALPLFMDFTGINITNYTNLQFSLFMAEDDDGSNEDWDASDYVHIFYQIDGGGFQNLLWLENDGSTFNTAPQLDTDFDGTGDGTLLTSRFEQFIVNIAGTGTLLDIRIEFQLNAEDEDIAIDNIMLSGDVIPEPATSIGLLICVCGVAVCRRGRTRGNLAA